MKRGLISVLCLLACQGGQETTATSGTTATTSGATDTSTAASATETAGPVPTGTSSQTTETTAPGTTDSSTSGPPTTGTTDPAMTGTTGVGESTTSTGSTTLDLETTGTTTTTGPDSCGDGIVDVDELCDDGNATPHDGCEDDCRPTLLDVQAGHLHTCVLFGSGAVKCWGGSPSGQLGYGHTDALGDEPGEMPTPDLDLGGKVVEIAAGYSHTCARLEDGAVRCWGENTYGQLGYGHTDPVGDEPGQMPPPDVQLDGSAVALSAGWLHTCALLATGEVRCWGGNAFGQLGLGHTEDIGDEPGEMPPPPAQVGDDIESISSGYTFNCVTRAGGEVRCWGENSAGCLGQADGMGENRGDEPGELPTPPVLVGAPVAQLGAGHSMVCTLLMDGSVRCWGNGEYGALGAGNTLDRGLFPGDMPPPAVDLGGIGVQLVSRFLRTCVRMDTGKLRCWGDAKSGDAHTGDEPGEMPPPDVPLPGSVQRVGGGDHHMCAIMVDGNLRCWGNGVDGQLGLGEKQWVFYDQIAGKPPIPLF
ncbi:DUF4215 domain-containing protein [Nannocystis radixulma]|uniref:Myxococcus cysteine-rich repeat-containing protein n=1 Tax=Nannocystis radixulma TaxID=2995305 RepID=A0ABT5BJC4_9BACT|nr:DUF4215 domain-containing protein [Nannocystis radixulma]MDC0674202.1 hypothetical protein [Nannocystis radixulma]